MTNSFTISSWQDVAIFVGIVATLSGLIGAMLRSWLDKRSAETAVADRLIRLAEVEAEKRVEIVRTEFKLQIAELQLEHRTEIDKMRNEFEKSFRSLKKEHDTYRCELAPVCGWRNKKVAPPLPASA